MSDITDRTGPAKPAPAIESRAGGFSLLGLFRRPEAGAAAGFILIFLFFFRHFVLPQQWPLHCKYWQYRLH